MVSTKVCVCVCVCVCLSVCLSVCPWTTAHQAPLSVEFFQAGILEWVAISFSKEFLKMKKKDKIFFYQLLFIQCGSDIFM